MKFIRSSVRPSGLLAGLAIGDALGAPLEGSAQPEAWLTKMLPGGLHFRKAGQWTDDTLQAVAVAKSLEKCRGFNPSDLVQRLLYGYENRPEWYGQTSAGFFILVKTGILPHRAAKLVHHRLHGSRTNGSVMRGFPLGIFYPAPEVYDQSLACSQLTHYDPVAAHCSAWLNVMASALCRGSTREQAYRHARSLCTNPEVHAMLGSYEQYCPVPSLDAVLCSHAALSSFMQARSFEGAVLSAINMGGDADTVGACTGALAGAYWGLCAIPKRWRDKLERYDELLALADRLWQVRTDHRAHR
ncbi:MAG: ADP-ribosylglycohydrolase family protein [Methanoregula sp.]|nr:ADP-ribosylglycohydrolase family protein [Methanoregula sp.]